MATFQPLTKEQYDKAVASGFSPSKIVDMEKIRKAESKVQEPKSFIGKVGEFLAPTASRAIGKAQKGEDLSARDIIGGALEVGSFLLPVGAIARGIGLAGKGALTLGRKLGLGALGGGLAGGTFETGRAIGEGKGALETIEAAGRGTALGAGAGVAIPGGFAAARGVKKGVEAIPQITATTKRGLDVAGRGLQTGTKAVTGAAQEGATLVGKRIPEKIGQFVERRAEQQARIKGQPVHVQEAVRKGIDQPIIDFVRSANPSDKAARVKMLDIAKKGATDFSFRGQAKQIPGKTILDGPIKHLVKTKDSGVAQTSKILSKLENKPQNVRSIYDDFLKDMTDLGLLPTNGRLVPIRGSKVPKGDVKFYQEIFNELRPNRAGNLPLTYKQLHQLRQKWFDVAKADKTFTSGPTSYARRIRSILGSKIDEASGGKYGEAQNKTREALQGLQNYARLTGYKGNLEDIGTKDLKAGEVFLRIFGNAADRPQSVLDEVYDVARKYGYKGNENITDQLRFADILEDVYGSPQTRSLRGQVARGAVDPLSGGLSAAREAAKWSPVSAALRLTRGFLSGTGEDTLKAFENLIRAEGGQKILQGAAPKTISELVEQTQKAASPLIKEGQRATKKASELGKKKVDNLIQEARKYKSAEEFVSKQPVVYHGSPVPLKSFSNKKGGVFFTDEYADATGFAGSPDNVYEGFLNFKKPLVIDAKGAKWDELNTKWGKSTQEVVGNAQKEGYDGVTFKNIVDNIADTEGMGESTIHYAFKPEDAFLNESQLTDIFNQAKGLPPKPPKLK